MAQYQNNRLSIIIENDRASFDGIIDELFVYTKVPAVESLSLRINLEKLKRINSCGIRELISWLNSLSPGQQVTYENAPIFFIHQASIVHGIVGPSRKVKTFFCPYFNEQAEQEVEKLISVDDIKSFKAPVFENLVFDSVEEKYFNFLRLQGERL